MDTALMEKELIAMGEKSLRAARSLALLSAEEKVNVLNSMADAVESATAEVLAANAIDMENAVKNNLSPRGVYEHRLAELKHTLMEDDCFLPGLQRQMGKAAAQFA